MAKNYILQFGATTWTGLSPTFSVFKVAPGGANPTGASAAPGITEIPTSSGLYYFTYAPLTSVAFVIDGGSALPAASRYIANAIDPIQAVDEQITALGSSLNVVIGTTASSFGSTAADPSTVMGYLKRIQENLEGNSIFTKTSGVWNIFARGNSVGASTQLIQKTVSDSGTVITKA